MSTPTLKEALESVAREVAALPAWLRDIYRRNDVLDAHRRKGNR